MSNECYSISNILFIIAVRKIDRTKFERKNDPAVSAMCSHYYGQKIIIID